MCSFLDINYLFFFFNDTATTEIYTLSLHDALPIFAGSFRIAIHQTIGLPWIGAGKQGEACGNSGRRRSEEHTSELQSRLHLVCRLLLEKKKRKHGKRRVLQL